MYGISSIEGFDGWRNRDATSYYCTRVPGTRSVVRSPERCCCVPGTLPSVNCTRWLVWKAYQHTPRGQVTVLPTCVQSGVECDPAQDVAAAAPSPIRVPNLLLKAA